MFESRSGFFSRDPKQLLTVCVSPRTVEVIKSSRPPSHKLLWSLLVFIFPIGGLIIYWLFSNRAAHNNGSGYEALP
jgi:hypothetical protein